MRLVTFCKLKNNSELPLSAVTATMRNIGALAKGEVPGSDPKIGGLAIYELRKKAEDPNYEILDSKMEQLLKDSNLMESSGTIHEEVKDVVLSAVNVEKDEILCINNPILEVLAPIDVDVLYSDLPIVMHIPAGIDELSFIFDADVSLMAISHDNI